MYSVQRFFQMSAFLAMMPSVYAGTVLYYTGNQLTDVLSVTIWLLCSELCGIVLLLVGLAVLAAAEKTNNHCEVLLTILGMACLAVAVVSLILGMAIFLDWYAGTHDMYNSHGSTWNVDYEK